MGSLVKNYLASTEKTSPTQVYHVTLMMCYDKKLEASRDDFYDDLYRTRDVDCVLTSCEWKKIIFTNFFKLFQTFSQTVSNRFTNCFQTVSRTVFNCYFDYVVEVEGMLDARSLHLSQCDSAPMSRLPGVVGAFHAAGGSAGGYLENILAFAARELFQHEMGPIEYKVIRYRVVPLPHFSVGWPVESEVISKSALFLLGPLWNLVEICSSYRIHFSFPQKRIERGHSFILERQQNGLINSLIN